MRHQLQKEKEEFVDEISANIKKLQSQVTLLERDNERIQIENQNDLQEKAKELELERENCRLQIEHFEAEKGAAQNQIKDLEAKMENLEKMLSKKSSPKKKIGPEAILAGQSSPRGGEKKCSLKKKKVRRSGSRYCCRIHRRAPKWGRGDESVE